MKNTAIDTSYTPHHKISFSPHHGLCFIDPGRVDNDCSFLMDAFNFFKRPTTAVCLAAKLVPTPLCLA